MRAPITRDGWIKIPYQGNTGKRPFFMAVAFMLMLSIPATTGSVLSANAETATCAALPVAKVTASGSSRSNIPSNIADSNLNTRWSSQGRGSWISLDVGKPANICYVDIAWHRGNERQNTFSLADSVDGKTFTPIFSGQSSKTSSFQRYDFTDVNARSIKVTAFRNTENNWASITEMKIYGYYTSGTQQDKIAPILTIDRPANDSEISLSSVAASTATIEIRGKASDSGSGIKVIQVKADNTAYKIATAASSTDWSSWSSTLALPVGVHQVTARATDNSGNQREHTISIKVKPAPTETRVSGQLPNPAPSTSKDKFGITKINPTAPGGIEWSSNWNNGDVRTIGNALDPDDKWFDAAHGEGRYSIDGKGTLVASGDFVRMYVHDPAKVREWSENLEITLYIKRISETQIVDYSGLQVFARTNHGTNGNEDVNLCDDRGYGGLVNVNGEWSFEKESAHHLDNGYDGAAEQRPSGNLPKDTWIGFKYVLRNMDGGSKVKLELYRDTTGGLNGGNWQKVTEFIDNGNNFGVGHGACKSGVNPGLPLIHSFINASSESKKPMLSVYARHEYGTMAYSNFSIREIDPLS
jgi:hypothetical protein